MDFKEIMEIVKTFLNAILAVFEALGIDFGKLFNKEEGETTTEAQ